MMQHRLIFPDNFPYFDRLYYEYYFGLWSQNLISHIYDILLLAQQILAIGIHHRHRRLSHIFLVVSHLFGENDGLFVGCIGRSLGRALKYTAKIRQLVNFRRNLEKMIVSPYLEEFFLIFWLCFVCRMR